MHNTKLLAVASLVVALAAINTPVQAGFFDTYNDGCSVHNHTLTCTGHHQASSTSVGAWSTTSHGPTPSFNSKGVIGFWDANDNIDISGALKTDNPPSVTTTYSCTHNTATLGPHGLNESVSTSNGKC